MEKRSVIKIENYFEVFLIISLIGLFLYVIKGFILTLLLASSLVFLSYKPYTKLNEKLNNNSLSAFVILSIVLILVIFPSYWLFSSLITETTQILTNSQTLLDHIDLSGCGLELCRNIERNLNFVDFSFGTIVIKFTNYLSSSVNSIFNSGVGVKSP